LFPLLDLSSASAGNATALTSMVNFDRILFAFTIASHIILVTCSIGLIVLISISEFLAIKRNDHHYAILAKKLTKAFTISFGVGTASGIVMAVELTILFPGFMTLVSETGAIALFYAEIFAFFLETIALVLYVYQSDYFRNRYSHWFLTVIIAGGALASAIFITMVNAWMNTPDGFNISAFIKSGTLIDVNPWEDFATASTFAEISHVLVTTIFTGVMIFGIFMAYKFIKSKDLEEKMMMNKGLKIVWIVSLPMLVLAGITGSSDATTLIETQPLKYAAFELNPTPGINLPEKFFGTISKGVFSGGILVPGLQSFLVDFGRGVIRLPGLSQFPQSMWPPLIVHTTFDIMIAGGLALLGFLLLHVIEWIFKKKSFESRIMLYLQVAAGFVSLLAYELGWVTAEVGRQPWIIYNVMLVTQAANYSSSFLIPGILIIVFYLILVPTTFYFFARVLYSRDEPDFEG
jgi:cytochrome bd ubiquinol oxidase subunit I